MGGGTGKHPLLNALTVLVAAADPLRAEKVLKLAIRHLLEDGDNRRLGSKKDVASWEATRDRLRAAMRERRYTTMMLAGELQLSQSAINKATAPSGQPPSPAVITSIEAWLVSRANPEVVPNGHDQDPATAVKALAALGKSQRAIADQLGIERGAVRRVLRPDDGRLLNGHDPPMPPGRLNPHERNALQQKTRGLDQMAIRLHLRMTPELLEQAIAGREVAGEAIARVRAFLQA